MARISQERLYHLMVLNTMSYKERISRQTWRDSTAETFRPIRGVDSGGLGGHDPRFWAGSHGVVAGVVGGPGRVVKYYILSCRGSMVTFEEKQNNLPRSTCKSQSIVKTNLKLFVMYDINFIIFISIREHNQPVSKELW